MNRWNTGFLGQRSIINRYDTLWYTVQECLVLSNLYTQSPRIFHLAKLKFGPCCSVAKIVSDSLPLHGLQHARFPCSSLSPGVFSSSCPLSQWFHPAISSSAVLLSSWPQSFQASGSFPISQFFTSGGQSIGASVSAAVHPMNIQGWFPWGLTSLISPCPRDFRVFSSNSTKTSIL